MAEYQEETRSHEALTYDNSGAIGTWAPSELTPGQALRQPAPLFKKLDERVGEEECRGWKDRWESVSRDSEIREPDLSPGSF